MSFPSPQIYLSQHQFLERQRTSHSHLISRSQTCTFREEGLRSTTLTHPNCRLVGCLESMYGRVSFIIRCHRYVVLACLSHPACHCEGGCCGWDHTTGTIWTITSVSNYTIDSH